jgi:ABC-2 type transport system permease protein
VNPSRAIRLVAKREITQRVREKAFLVSTLFSLAVIAVVVFLPALLDNDESGFAIGVTQDVPQEMRGALAGARVLAGGGELRLVDLDDAGAAEDAVRSGDVDAALINGTEVVVDQQAPPEFEATLQGIAQQMRVTSALRDAGVPIDRAAEALDPQPLEIRALNPPDPNEESRQGVAWVGVLLLYGQIFAYGYWVSMGVLEEKASRVVELVLSKIRPSQLLAGKVIGIGLLGLSQLLIVVGVGLAVAIATGSIDLPPGTAGVIGIVVAWFLLGYAFYACCFAVAGSLVSRMEELQSTTAPMSVLLVGSFFLAIFSLNDPDSMLARIGSFFPPSAPLIMPQRLAANAASWLESGLSMVLIVIVTAALIPLAGRIYAGAILRTGGPVKIREAWRSSA